MIGRKALIESIAGLAMLPLAMPVLACTISLPPQPLAGESPEAFHARVRAEDEVARRYANASPQERAVIDQARLWEESPLVFVARIDWVKQGKQVFGPEKPISPARGLRYRNGRPLPPKPVPPPRLLLPFNTHSAYVRPLHWLKGSPEFKGAWHEVGGMTTCGSSMDGDLGYARPGEQAIVFAGYLYGSDRKGGTKRLANEFRLYGIRRSDAAAPELLAALKQAKPGSK